MKYLSIESLKKYKLTREEKSKILAKGTRLDGGPDTDGEENCFPILINPITKLPYKNPLCL